MATHFYCCLLLSLTVLQGLAALQFDTENDAPTTPGGIRFTNELGFDFTKETMQTTTNFIWNLFGQNSVGDRKDWDQVILKVADLPGFQARTSAAMIEVGANLLAAYKGDIKQQFTALLYHEMTHVWQWFGGDNNKAPNGLVEGISDYTVLKALGGYPDGFAKPGEGEKWDEGYSVTARFLEYCEGIKPGFVTALNMMMKDDYSDDYFNQLLGESVDDLWKEYKAKFGGGNVSGQKYRFRRWGGYIGKQNRILV